MKTALRNPGVFITLMTLLLPPASALAADRFWIGVGGNGNSTANWAASTGGELRLASDWELALASQTFLLTNGVLNLGTNDLRLTAINTDFKMQSANTELRATLTDLRTRLAVTRNTTVAGTLRFDLLQGGFMPELTDVIPLITSGTAVSGTFAQTIGQRGAGAVQHLVFYNDGGNNVKLTGIALVQGSLFLYR